MRGDIEADFLLRLIQQHRCSIYFQNQFFLDLFKPKQKGEFLMERFLRRDKNYERYPSRSKVLYQPEFVRQLNIHPGFLAKMSHTPSTNFFFVNQKKKSPVKKNPLHGFATPKSLFLSLCLSLPTVGVDVWRRPLTLTKEREKNSEKASRRCEGSTIARPARCSRGVWEPDLTLENESLRFRNVPEDVLASEKPLPGGFPGGWGSQI